MSTRESRWRSADVRRLDGAREGGGAGFAGAGAAPHDVYTLPAGLPVPEEDGDRDPRAGLELPTFEIAGLTLYKRLTLVAEDARIVKVFYPVFPPDANAGDVLAWLRAR